MTDTAIMGGDVEVHQRGSSPISWSAIIAGAIAATAVTFLVISLGTGIGLSLASPYRNGPSATTMTAIGAVWLVMAQAFGFACGGYLAARLRAHFNDSFGEETRFRDAAQGFLVWALGVVMMTSIAALAGVFTAGAAASITGQTAAAAVNANTAPGARNPDGGPTVYFVDVLFRPSPNGTPSSTISQGQPAAGTDAANHEREQRAEVARVLARSVSQGQLSNEDRQYLVQLVSQRTGLSPDEAQRRVNDVENQIRQTVDTATKAGSYLSFWTFMSLLIGAVAATLAGIVGGELRDAETAAAAGLGTR